MAIWQQLQELRKTADSNPTSCHYLQCHTSTSTATCARAQMTAALIAQRGRCSARRLTQQWPSWAASYGTHHCRTSSTAAC